MNEPLVVWEVQVNKQTGKWKSLSRRTVQKIEAYYFNGQNPVISSRKEIHLVDNQYIMYDKSHGTSHLVRRTTVQWSYRNTTRWIPLETAVMRQLEDAARKGTHTAIATVGCNIVKFCVNERVMMDQNSNKTCRIRRLCQTSFDARHRIQQPPFKKTHGEIRYQLEPPSEKELYELSCLFNGDPNMLGYELTKVEKVVNQELLDGFERKKQQMADGHNETLLFHGCPRGVLGLICNEGFDVRLNGKHATQYGKGTYFAKYPSYSHKFSDVSSSHPDFQRDEKDHEWKMIASRVAIGCFTQGHKSYVRPPRVHQSGVFFDSVVDSPSNPHVFVVFEREQAYPGFLVTYKKCHEISETDSDSESDEDVELDINSVPDLDMQSSNEGCSYHSQSQLPTPLSFFPVPLNHGSLPPHLQTLQFYLTNQSYIIPPTFAPPPLVGFQYLVTPAVPATIPQLQLDCATSGRKRRRYSMSQNTIHVTDDLPPKSLETSRNQKFCT